MANTKYAGKLVFLYASEYTLTGGVYKLVACVTEQTLDRSKTEIDASSKCGPDFLVGTDEDECTATIQRLVGAAEAGTIGIRELEGVGGYSDGVTIDWKISDDLVAPQYEDIEFSGKIFTVSSNWGLEDAASSDITIKIVGGVTYNAI
jgi:hypothetical protein